MFRSARSKWIFVGSLVGGCVDESAVLQADDLAGTSLGSDDAGSESESETEIGAAPSPDPWLGSGDAPVDPIVSPTPVPPDQLLAVVEVIGTEGVCTGTLIADDRVLTAGHCFCTWDYVGSNDCGTTATVVFRPNPAVPGSGTVSRTGTVTVHPDYNPSWTDREIENDLAIIALDSVAPSYSMPMAVATSNPWSGTTVRVVGFGYTGPNCDGPAGTLNYADVPIGGYEDYSKIIRFDDQAVCEGDSGGAVMNTAGTLVYGVHSFLTWTVKYGAISKSIAVAPYYEWIRSHTCSSVIEDRCDGTVQMCRCRSGLGDCDTNADCESGLTCAQDVGATFGYPASTDVCVTPGPIEGTCGCSNSGLANICMPSYNNCAAGFAAVCSPSRGSCGGCSCQ